jgi:hypothetical protein
MNDFECHPQFGYTPVTFEAQGFRAVRWFGEENCKYVFAFLGFEHPDDELDHSQIHFNSTDSRSGTVTAYPGNWIVRDGAGLHRYTHEDFLKKAGMADRA